MRTLAGYAPLIALAALVCLVLAIARSGIRRSVRIVWISALLIVAALAILFVLSVAQVAGTGYN